MNRQTSRRAALLTGFLACALAFSLAQPAAGAVDERLLSLLPGQSTVLMGVDVQGFQATPLYRYLETKEGADDAMEQLNAFAALIGFDPRRDLDHFVAGVWQAPGAEPGAEPSVLVAASGRFGSQLLHAQAAEHAVSTAEYRGVTLYTMPADGGNDAEEAEEDGDVHVEVEMSADKPQTLAFLSDSTAVFGNEVAVRGAVDKQNAGTSGMGLNAELSALADKASDGTQFWSVSTGVGELIAENVPEGDPAEEGPQAMMVEIMKTMSELSFAIDFMSGMRMDMEGLFASAEDAQTISDAMRGLLAMGRLSAPPEYAEMTRMLDAVLIDSSSNAVTVSVNIDQMDFETMLEKLDSADEQGTGGE